MIPSLEECDQLMARYRMLANIREHSLVVAKVAELLAASLLEKGVAIQLDLAISAALLHDIGKSMCLDNDADHAALGQEICQRHGYDEIAPIVLEHVILRQAFPQQALSAKEIVYYADKRVNHDRIVSLAERLDYIVGRYGRGCDTRCQAIRKNFQRCLLIEEEIFRHLSWGPSALAGQVAEHGGKVARFFAGPTGRVAPQ